ncbi:hypothetical protein ACCO45_010892 [Purpureocillium lilacinum]|uniref:Uncharacterized protein n=1 Tax=Purpureocillium lilacinum TaxID=33203 RepID=A0ACC4DHJ0_PURLI
MSAMLVLQRGCILPGGVDQGVFIGRAPFADTLDGAPRLLRSSFVEDLLLVCDSELAVRLGSTYTTKYTEPARLTEKQLRNRSPDLRTATLSQILRRYASSTSPGRHPHPGHPQQSASTSKASKPTQDPCLLGHDKCAALLLFPDAREETGTTHVAPSWTTRVVASFSSNAPSSYDASFEIYNADSGS